MALVVPAIAGFGLFLIHKNKNKNKNIIDRSHCDGFISKHNLINKSSAVGDDLEVDNNINEYKDANNSFTDKYYTKKNNNEDMNYEFKSLNGEKINSQDFNHNNMVPYFGKSKLNGNGFIDNAATDSVLDSRQGNNSFSVEKVESAPLFKPEENIQWAHGSPNETEFIKSRQNVSMVANNVNPFKENTETGNLGYNSGAESRDIWQPKSVDDLRITSNPKLTYNMIGREGPAHSKVQERGIHGKLEKHLPEKFYENYPNRYLTTTGLQKAPTVRSIYNNKDVNRAVSVEYTGAPNLAVDNCKAQSNYRLANKASKQLDTESMGMPQRLGGGAYAVNQNNMNIPQNNRTNTGLNDRSGIVTNVVSSVAAPIMDMLRPTRKEDLVNSVRVNGQAGPGTVVSAGSMHDPMNKVKTTTKETTQYSPFNYGMPSVDNNHTGGYNNTNYEIAGNQRDTTNINYVGGANNNTQLPSYESNYNQSHNTNRCNKMNMNHGNTNMFNNSINQSINDNKSSLNTEYTPNINGNLNSSVPSAQTFGKLHVPPYENKPSNQLDGNLLNAFKNNPYTHSLSTVVQY